MGISNKIGIKTTLNFQNIFSNSIYNSYIPRNLRMDDSSTGEDLKEIFYNKKQINLDNDVDEIVLINKISAFMEIKEKLIQQLNGTYDSNSDLE